MLADTEFNEVTGLNTTFLPSLSEKLLFQFDTVGDQPAGLRIREAAAVRAHFFHYKLWELMPTEL